MTKRDTLLRKAKQIPRPITNPASFHAAGVLAQIREHEGENKD